MPFSALSAGDRIRIMLQLVGGPEYVTQVKLAAGATEELGAATRLAGDEASTAYKKTFAYQQAVFTLRRIAFYSTLAIAGLGFEAIKMGLSFDASMQNARVAFQGFIPSAQGVNNELRQIYIYAALTPFQFPDLVTATRRLLPFIGNLQLTNNTVKALGDSLAAAGTVSGTALTRATLQIAHMASIGRLTGQVLLALSRDNIPMMQALEQQFHATGATIRSAISSGAISAQTAITALINYTNTAPGYVNKATEFSKKSLTGAFSTFKDLVRIAFGSSTQGIFNEALVRLNAINRAILPLVRGDKPVSITNLATALDTALTPKTHIILNLFTLFGAMLQQIYWNFKELASIISWFLGLLNKLTSGFGGATNGSKMLGDVIGTMVTVFIIWRGAIFAAEIALVSYKALTYAVAAAEWLLEAATWANVWAQVAAMTAFLEFDMIGLTFAATLAAIKTQFLLLTASMEINPFVALATLVLLLIAGLVILYLKWKPFRDLVNDTATWLWKNWTYAGLLFAILLPGVGVAVYLVGMLVKHWQDVAGAIQSVVNVLKAAYSWILKIINAVTKNPGKLAKYLSFVPGMSAIGPAIGLFAHQTGGIMSGGGLALVGEGGPEVVHLPMGSRIQPVPNTSGVIDAQSGGPGQPIVIQLVMNRKVLEEAVVDIQQRRNARA